VTGILLGVIFLIEIALFVFLEKSKNPRWNLARRILLAFCILQLIFLALVIFRIVFSVLLGDKI
jgi:hypothetical protein